MSDSSNQSQWNRSVQGAMPADALRSFTTKYNIQTWTSLYPNFSVPASCAMVTSFWTCRNASRRPRQGLGSLLRLPHHQPKRATASRRDSPAHRRHRRYAPLRRTRSVWDPARFPRPTIRSPCDRTLIPLARRHGFNELWITSNPENIASRRTCEIAGAELAEIVDLPPRIDMYQEGERQKCRYRLTL